MTQRLLLRATILLRITSTTRAILSLSVGNVSVCIVDVAGHNIRQSVRMLLANVDAPTSSLKMNTHRFTVGSLQPACDFNNQDEGQPTLNVEIREDVQREH